MEENSIGFKANKLFWSNVERVKHVFSKQPEKFLALKEKYKGEKCFVVATGPSLTLADLELIKGHYSFSINSIVKSFDKTSWRPNFYAITDPAVYTLFGKRVEEINDFDLVLYPIWMDKNVEKNTHFINNRHQILHAQAFDSYRGKIYPTKKPEKYIVDAPSVIFSVIQIAIFMGFKEIYLLGQDCNYKMKKQHSEIADLGAKTVIKQSCGDHMIDVFYNYAEALQNTDVIIYNCTRGGMLEAFKRIPLEEAIKN